MILDELTWPEIDALDREAVLPVWVLAATEQHSLHLPLATDRLIGNEVVWRAERQLPDSLLVMPPVAVGCSSHHLGFAGTLSVRHATLLATIEDLVDSMVRHRFRRLLLLNSHGGNHAVMSVAIQQLMEKHPGFSIVGASYWTLARQKLMELRETGPGGMGHACELETSILLVICPDLVRMDLAECDGAVSTSPFLGGEMLFPPPVVSARSFSEITRHGGFGDPVGATAAKGERFLAAIVESVVALCKEVLNGRA